MVWANLLGCCQRPATREHGQTCEQHALRLVKKLVTPLDRGPQRLLAWKRGSSALHQQSDLLIQTLGQKFDRQPRNACGRQFECQRHSIESPTYLSHCAGIVLGKGEAGSRTGGTLSEQPHRRKPGQARWLDFCARLGRKRQRRECPCRLTPNAERLATGVQHTDRRALLEERFDNCGRGLHQVLTIVENDQQLAAL